LKYPVSDFSTRLLASALGTRFARDAAAKHKEVLMKGGLNVEAIVEVIPP
jgi:hypothetical protein